MSYRFTKDRLLYLNRSLCLSFSRCKQRRWCVAPRRDKAIRRNNTFYWMMYVNVAEKEMTERMACEGIFWKGDLINERVAMAARACPPANWILWRYITSEKNRRRRSCVCVYWLVTRKIPRLAFSSRALISFITCVCICQPHFPPSAFLLFYRSHSPLAANVNQNSHTAFNIYRFCCCKQSLSVVYIRAQFKMQSWIWIISKRTYVHALHLYTEPSYLMAAREFTS